MSGLPALVIQKAPQVAGCPEPVKFFADDQATADE
jgi:hypothetical protein